jgi:two-component system sensor histidine kinase PhcS
MPQPAADAPLSAPLVRHKQRTMVGVFLMIMPFWALDLLTAWPRVPWDTLLIRVGWVGLSVTCAWALAFFKVRVRGASWFVTGLLLPNLSLFLIIWRLGGSASPMFAWFCAMPLLGITLSLGNVRRSVVSAGVSLMAGLSMLVAEGQPVVQLGVWALLIGGSGILAVQASGFHARLLKARGEAERSQRQAQEALAATRTRAQESDRLAQVGRLAAGVAHEVNNPLAFIQANLSYLGEELAREGRSPEDLLAVVKETQEGVARIKQIVQDLTALARGATELEPREVGRCPLPAVIEESMRLASVRLKKLAVEVEVPAGVPTVRADPRRLGQVLLNLLLNAADALEESGVERPKVALRVQAQGPKVSLVLEDNGPGFAAEHLQRLFTPFFTTKAQGKGTGLGLALSRQYVEGFGGVLRAENRPEGGARFTVELLPD